MMESSMKYETIILDRKDGIGYLTLNRPDRANTIAQARPIRPAPITAIVLSTGLHP